MSQRIRSYIPHHTPHTALAGFTLLEMMVSVSILVLLSGILLVGAAAARRHAVVRSAAQQFAGFLREARGLTVNGVKATGCDPSNPDCSKYTVFFGPPGRQDNEYSRRPVAAGGTEIRATLPAGAVFDSYGQVQFEYEPPTAKASRVPPVDIVIRHVSGSPEVRVCVTVLGGVEVLSARNCPS